MKEQDYKQMLAETKFPYITEKEREYIVSQYKTSKGAFDKLCKENDATYIKINHKPIKMAEISVEWKKSRTWGLNPTANMRVWYQGGGYSSHTSTASGCGYDKLSTVIASVLNDCPGAIAMAYKAYKNSPDGMPYGLHKSDYDIHPYFEGGVGINCYLYKGNIFDFVGLDSTHVSGKLYDHISLRAREE